MTSAAPLAPKTRFLMAHYMPWYEADPARGAWGWHWTMNHFRPERKAPNGRREAASHYYPLLGLYDSNDPDVLECHVLLMKLSGIDGVVVDWYGIDDFLDYGLIHRNTRHLVAFVKKAGLRFAVMYEEAQTVPKLLAAKRLPGDDVVAHGQRVLRWVRDHWFADPAYLKHDGRPVFFTFGTGYYSGEQWKEIFAGLAPGAPPLYLTEWDRRAPADGAFYWPNPDQGTDTALRRAREFHETKARTWPAFAGGAFPRFHDVYAEAKVHKSWGRVEDRGGKVYEETLTGALTSGAPVVQIATWNDWGEGTMIEPSAEFGFRDLEATQRLRRRHVESRFAFTPEDLRLPVALYRLRKQHKGTAAHAAPLGEVSRLLFAGQTREARALLRRRYPDALGQTSPVPL
jgi:Glycosyl hydrolase family 71.